MKNWRTPRLFFTYPSLLKWKIQKKTPMGLLRTRFRALWLMREWVLRRRGSPPLMDLRHQRRSPKPPTLNSKEYLMMVGRSCCCFSASSAPEMIFSFALALSEDQKFRRSLLHFLLRSHFLQLLLIATNSANVLAFCELRMSKGTPETVLLVLFVCKPRGCTCW